MIDRRAVIAGAVAVLAAPAPAPRKIMTIAEYRAYLWAKIGMKLPSFS